MDPLPDGAVVIFSTDITDEEAHRILLERESVELARLVEQLQQKNRELDQFTGAASHDLRAPLRTIAMCADVLEEDHGDTLDETGRALLDRIQQRASRMADMVDALLTHARLGQGQPESVNTTELLHAVLQDLEAQLLASGATVQATELPTVRAFPVELRLLFQNLVANALEYHRPDVTPRVEVSAREIPNGWQFSVEDNGTGIPEKYRERIFNAFARLHTASASGVGIGLAHAEKIVALHGGRIWVESEPGVGSVFHFTLHEPRPAPGGWAGPPER